MVEVVFHIGAHKCATTTIQHGVAALAQSRPRLVYVPPIVVTARQPPNGGAEALGAFAQHVRKRPPGGPNLERTIDIVCRWIDAQRDAERIVFSEENVIGAMPGISWSFYPRASVTRAVIDGVASRFPVSVLLQSRETASYLKSCHQFRVRFGMTLSYLAFLDRFDLGSLSWERFGETLFAGASFRWRVLPIERFAEPGGAADIAETLRFVVPGWNADQVPLSHQNPSNGPLMRAASLVLRRAGFAFEARPRGRVALAVKAVEADVFAAGPDVAAETIREALAGAKVEIDATLAHVIRHEAEEERAPSGALQRLLTDRFSDDYAAFRTKFAPGAV